jgi:hypothetical protein
VLKRHPELARFDKALDEVNSKHWVVESTSSTSCLP